MKGGVGIEIELDESNFGRTKYGKGRQVKGAGLVLTMSELAIMSTVIWHVACHQNSTNY